MIHVITAVGVLICAAALVGLAAPAAISRLALRVVSTRRLRLAAVGARIIFGAIAILVANDTPYALAMKIIGVLAIMAGTLASLAGRDAMSRWIDRMRGNPGGFRVFMLGALALGAFLVHATVDLNGYPRTWK